MRNFLLFAPIMCLALPASAQEVKLETPRQVVSYGIGPATAQAGFPCQDEGYGTNLGILSDRGVAPPVRYQDTSILQNHGAFDSIQAASTVCATTGP